MNKSIVGTVAVGFLAFAGAFAATLAARWQQPAPTPSGPVDQPLARWLGLDSETAKAIADGDPTFRDDLASLRRKVEEARATLAALLERADVSDDELRSQVETVIATHNALERRVTDHLIAVRHHLTPGQQKKLFGLCADNIRQGEERRLRERWQKGDGPTGDPPGHGRGRGPRHGRERAGNGSG